MTLNDSIRYDCTELFVDNILVESIAQSTQTPFYLYSQRRILQNLQTIQDIFSGLNAYIHFSAKANANLTILGTLIQAGVGIDVVSGGEFYKARKAGANPQDIVFAGVGKGEAEIAYALENNIGWFNVENEYELTLINHHSQRLNRTPKIALRLNPEVTANTHPYIATGHGGAKFGLTLDAIQKILAKQEAYPELDFAGIHIHIGSQLQDISATKQAIQKASALMQPYPNVQTLNIGGGFPVQYRFDEALPSLEHFAQQLHPFLKDLQIFLEPGRSIVGDAGILVTTILYIKQHAGQTFYIVDASMSELIRPSLYQAYHEIMPLKQSDGDTIIVQVVGPVCESTDVLGRDRKLSKLQRGDKLAILTAGAYGSVMASNYNARPKPAEVMVDIEGEWHIIRQRETWDELSYLEQNSSKIGKVN